MMAGEVVSTPSKLVAACWQTLGKNTLNPCSPTNRHLIKPVENHAEALARPLIINSSGNVLPRSLGQVPLG
jgi:hypothetical protein